MANRCKGIREDNGDPCQRNASGKSEFCYQHKGQEENYLIRYAKDDTYFCPIDGGELRYWPRGDARLCAECEGLLLNGKNIDPRIQCIVELPKAEDEDERIGCPTCKSDSDISVGENLMTNISVEWAEIVGRGQYTPGQVFRGVTNVGYCEVCGSFWFNEIGKYDDKGKRVDDRGIRIKGIWTKGVWRRNITTWLDNRDMFQEHNQWQMRQGRLEKIESLGKRKIQIYCNHIDSATGIQCGIRKSTKSTHDADYCYKHQPK